MKLGNIELPNDFRIGIVVGPNGSRKTRSAIEMAKSAGEPATFIAAFRYMTVPPSAQINSQVDSEILKLQNQFLQAPHGLLSDISPVLGKAIQAEANYLLSNKYAANPQVASPTAGIWQIFHQSFPDRELQLELNRLNIQRGQHTIPSSEWSDGERAALYLLAKIATSDANLVLVDEPTIHLHEDLAVRFWRAVLQRYESKKFILITHDLRFAMALSPDFACVANGSGKFRLVDSNDLVSDELVAEVYGSAILNSHFRQLILCEGRPGGIDDRIYGALADQNVLVMPVGSCGAVLHGIEVLSSSKVLSNLVVKGIVDADWGSKKAGVTVLDYHDIESFLSSFNVFEHVCKAVKCSTPQQDWKTTLAEHASVVASDPERVNYYIREALRDFVESSIQIRSHITSKDPSIVSTAISKHLNDIASGLSEKQITITTELKNALSSHHEELLKLIPGKDLLNRIQRIAGVDRRRYEQLAVDSEPMRSFACASGLRSKP
ncbi:MAG: AAA family ATPase [Cyanobacteria bacterium J06656_5]